VTDPNFSAIRARLRYESLDDFIDGYSRFISTGGMFIPMAPSKLKPVGTTIRFQFLLQDGSTAMLGEGVVRQIQGADSDDNSAVGMLVKFTKLSRDSKKVVQRVVARKDDADSLGLVPDSDPLEAAAPEAHAQDEPVPAEDDFATDSEVIPQADDAHTRDVEDGDTGVLKPEDNDALNEMFLDADDDEDEASDDNPAVEVAASGSDVFSEAEADSEPVDAEPVDAEPVDAEPEGEEPVGGPKQLGRTEAGLQIMAFDDVSDDEMADFGEFDFGGDEDDVDQMFDGIFGGGGGDDDGGGLFGGGDDEGDGDFFGGGSDEHALVADSVNDGGSPVEDDGGDTREVDEHVDEPLGETFDLDEEVELDEESSPDSLSEDSVDETFDLDEEIELDEELVLDDEEIELDEEELVLDDEEIELDEEELVLDEEIELDDEEIELDEEELVLDDEEIELDEESDFETEEPYALDEDSEPEPDAHGGFDRPATEQVEDADVLLEEALDEDEPDAHGGFDRPSTERVEDADVLFEEDLDEDSEPEPELPAADLAREDSNPSDDLMSALGALDSDGEEELELSLGADAAQDESSEEEAVEEDDDEEESLESLLALAQQDIDAKREVQEEEEDQGDILDNLLGGDDMPPPPSNDPVFDIGDSDKKKKKGGFMSKLFGKD
jgi:hypothetical protein